MPFRLGFNFSAGLVDWILSFKAPMAVNPWLLIPLGIAFSIVYYSVFRFLILKFDLKTPGRTEEDAGETNAVLPKNNDYSLKAANILEGLGGKANISELDHCATRLRIEIRDGGLIDEVKIKKSGALGVIKPSEDTIQIIIGTKVQFIYEELKELIK
jgi:PTS system N-acetylglucosamine-specific IIC component